MTEAVKVRLRHPLLTGQPASSVERRHSGSCHVWSKSVFLEKFTKQLIQFPKLNAAQISNQRGTDPSRSSSQRLIESFALKGGTSVYWLVASLTTTKTNVPVCVCTNCCGWIIRVHDHKLERNTRATRRPKTRIDGSPACSLRKVNICCHNWRAEQSSVAIFPKTRCATHMLPVLWIKLCIFPVKGWKCTKGSTDTARTKFNNKLCFTEPCFIQLLSVSSSCSYPGTPPSKKAPRLREPTHSDNKGKSAFCICTRELLGNEIK